MYELVYFSMILILRKLSQPTPLPPFCSFWPSTLRFGLFSMKKHLHAVLSSSLQQCFLDQRLSRLSLLLILSGDKSINCPGSFMSVLSCLQLGVLRLVSCLQGQARAGSVLVCGEVGAGREMM